MNVISNAEFVEQLYGVWPSFHDAEVLNFSISFVKKDAAYTSDANFIIYYSGQDLIPSSRKYPICLIEFECIDVRPIKLDVSRVSGGCWIDEMRVTKATNGGVLVDLQPLAGVDLKFECAKISVVDIRPRSEIAEKR